MYDVKHMTPERGEPWFSYPRTIEKRPPYSANELSVLMTQMVVSGNLAVLDIPASLSGNMSLTRFLVETADLDGSRIRLSLLREALASVRRDYASERLLAARGDARATLNAAAARDKPHIQICATLRKLASRRNECEADYYLEILPILTEQVSRLDCIADIIGTASLSGFRKAELFFNYGSSYGLRYTISRLIESANFDQLDRLASAARTSGFSQFVVGLRDAVKAARIRHQFNEFSTVAAQTQTWLNRWTMIDAAEWLDGFPLLEWLSVLSVREVVLLRQSQPGQTWFVRGVAFDAAHPMPVPTTREGRDVGAKQIALLKNFMDPRNQPSTAAFQS